MKLTVQQENLAHSLNLVIRAVGVKPALPVLNNILLDLKNGQLRLAATNLETSMVTYLAVSTDDEGTITVPARLLHEFVSSLSAGNLTLETKDENLIVTSGKFEANFACIAATEFPNMPTPLKSDKILLEKTFAKALNQTIFAASADSGRPVLTGLLLEFKPGKLDLVATDGYRLAKKSLTVDSTLETSLLIPARALAEVARLISESGDEDEVSLQPLMETNQVIFTIGMTQITTRLLDGSFPQYQTIIPEKFTTRGIFTASEIASAVKTASLFARDLGNVVHLSLDPDAGEIEFSANTAQVGGGKAKVAGSIEGEKVAIAFNSQYITAGLSVLTGAQISLETIDSTKPARLQPVGETDFFYIIMPVRQQG